MLGPVGAVLAAKRVVVEAAPLNLVITDVPEMNHMVYNRHVACAHLSGELYDEPFVVRPVDVAVMTHIKSLQVVYKRRL